MVSHRHVPADTTGTFTFGERLGLFIYVLSACLSAIAVLSYQVYIGRRFFRLWKSGQLNALLRQSPFFLLIFAGLVSNLIQSAGTITHIRWIRLAGVKEGIYCTIEGILSECGHPSVAMTNIAMTFFTYRRVIQNKPLPSFRTVLTIFGFIYFGVLLVVSIGLTVGHIRHDPYMGNTVWWCSIRVPPYLAWSLGAKYAWYWITALVSFVLYGRMAYDFYTGGSGGNVPYVDRGVQQKLAPKIIFYPLIYTICILPISVTRVFQSSTGHPPPFEATAFAGVLAASSGFWDVLLLIFMKSDWLPRVEKPIQMTEPGSLESGSAFPE